VDEVGNQYVLVSRPGGPGKESLVINNGYFVGKNVELMVQICLAFVLGRLEISLFERLSISKASNKFKRSKKLRQH